MSVDLSELWDYGKPELSEQRFRTALANASPEDALILQTQIARTYGLRRDFATAREVLAGIEPQIKSASTEAQVHYYLELGRSYASATHPPDSQTDESRQNARIAFLKAFEIAQESGLDGLAVDALHMMTMVDTSPLEQIEWNRKALDYVAASSQPEAKKWSASLLNNLGYALYLAGRYEEALVEFELALAEREKRGNPESIRIAWWMIAWTLNALNRLDEAVEIQLRLEAECDQAGEPDPYVFEELEILYRKLGNSERADDYADRRKAVS